MKLQTHKTFQDIKEEHFVLGTTTKIFRTSLQNVSADPLDHTDEAFTGNYDGAPSKPSHKFKDKPTLLPKD